jgi:hypothetical protein
MWQPRGVSYAPPPPGPWPYPPQPKEPRATTALILGLIGVVGGWMCCLPVVVSPFALVYGKRSLDAIREQPHLGGHGEALAGFVLGICGTALMALGALVVVGFISWWVADPISFATFWED